MNKFKKIAKNPAAWAVIIFIVLFVWGLKLANAGELDALVGVGYGSSHDSSLITQELGLRYKDHWGLSLVRTGNEPRIEDTLVTKVDYRVSWREGKQIEPFLAFGAAYWNDRPTRFVNDNLTFALAAGLSYSDIVELVWQHYSTSGRSSPNWGIDYVELRAVLRVK